MMARYKLAVIESMKILQKKLNIGRQQVGGMLVDRVLQLPVDFIE